MDESLDRTHSCGRLGRTCGGSALRRCSLCGVFGGVLFGWGEAVDVVAEHLEFPGEVNAADGDVWRDLDAGGGEVEDGADVRADTLTSQVTSKLS